MQGWSFTPFFGAQEANNRARDAAFAEEERQRLNEVNMRELDEVAAANQQAAETFNRSATQRLMAKTRRQLGGGAVRSRIKASSANQLVSGLGAANAKALAERRRAVIRGDVGQAKTNFYNSPASQWNNGITPFVMNS